MNQLPENTRRWQKVEGKMTPLALKLIDWLIGRFEKLKGKGPHCWHNQT